MVVHIGTQRDALDSLAVGADGLAHGFVDEPPSPELLREVGRRKVFFVPNLSSTALWCAAYPGPQLAADRALSPYLSEAAVKTLTVKLA